MRHRVGGGDRGRTGDHLRGDHHPEGRGELLDLGLRHRTGGRLRGSVRLPRLPRRRPGSRRSARSGTEVVRTNLGDFPFWKDTVVTWELEPRDGKTHVFFRHGNWADDYPE